MKNFWRKNKNKEKKEEIRNTAKIEGCFEYRLHIFFE